jgi:predicted ATP-grasp superfamily ATP-dependent carboligase
MPDVKIKSNLMNDLNKALEIFNNKYPEIYKNKHYTTEIVLWCDSDYKIRIFSNDVVCGKVIKNEITYQKTQTQGIEVFID